MGISAFRALAAAAAVLAMAALTNGAAAATGKLSPLGVSDDGEKGMSESTNAARSCAAG